MIVPFEIVESSPLREQCTPFKSPAGYDLPEPLAREVCWQAGLPEFAFQALRREPPLPLSWLASAGHLMRSLCSWARSGFGLASTLIYLRRLAICRRCPRWDMAGWFATGKCTLCGCSRWKLKLPSARCPDLPPRW